MSIDGFKGMRLFLSSIVAILALGLSSYASQAAGVVTDCSTFGPGTGTLQEALVGGGTITFACSGTIVMPAFTASSDTFLDGSGQNITLEGGVYVVHSGITLSMSHLSLAGGGAIATGAFNIMGGTLIITSTTLTGNFGGNGGAIYNDHGTITISDTTISNNTADQGNAGGILNASGIVTITNSLITGNSSPSSLSPYGGGGILNAGTLNIENSTISGNSTNYNGGGIFNDAGTTTIINSTIYDNSANNVGNDIYLRSGTVTVKNSIIAGNSIDRSCDGLVSITDNGFNLSTDSGCNSSTVTTLAQLNLGSLANNGGVTQIHALLTGSVAIDAGNCDAGNDQRDTGFPRPVNLPDIPNASGGNGCDIGAFEFQSEPSDPVTTPEPTSPPAATPKRAYFVVPTPTLTWNPISWAASYDIDVANNADFVGAAHYSTDADELSITVDTPPLTDGQYFWRVRAVSPARVSAWSKTETFFVDVP